MATQDKSGAIRANVTISNAASGPRFVNTAEGPRTIMRGETATGLSIREAELADLPDGLTVGDMPEGDAFEGSDETGAFALTELPADLRSDRSNDGIVGRDKLVKIASDEGAAVESDDNKAELVRKIMANRAGASGGLPGAPNAQGDEFAGAGITDAPGSPGTDAPAAEADAAEGEGGAPAEDGTGS
jgi:hypothetical protein